MALRFLFGLVIVLTQAIKDIKENFKIFGFEECLHVSLWVKWQVTNNFDFHKKHQLSL